MLERAWTLTVSLIALLAGTEVGAVQLQFVQQTAPSQADLWDMLEEEVFAPIGILHAPAVRTREPDGRDALRKSGDAASGESLHPGEDTKASADDAAVTFRAVDRLAPF
jgi:hypothetical protein